jgi:hypothetical protein
MLSSSSSKLSSSFILNSAPYTRSTVEQEKAMTPLGAANLVLSNSPQPLLSSRYIDMLVKVNQALFLRDFLASLFT